ncbi:hypothetical protein C1H57_09675 [Clostridium sp. 2-1]|uniref:hypothetical protein n=1 Tax=Clostridium TaxID=1485 RepID=UPI0004177613|nr:MULTISPECIES: hypothetical protein [Clostridium]MBN7575534.1 hypothetical protein [Clostridium beijerinckii]MBN7580845.1 hypothetical protein [Clostridium beijerinckii]MBN7585298.1 hypothetical protein [Clostridium beijerinckii]MBO0521130.1 hypothetical protein [Clostridium beijerinckii]POO91514.1 hypothetical protein C1H57_09675 [Clostridium sp. 2-1]
MLKFNDFKKLRNSFSLFITLCIFIFGFYMIGFICMKNSNTTNPVIIEKDLFTDSNLNKRVQDFVISHVEQIKIPNIYYNKYDYIDNHLMEAMVYDSETGMPELSIFDKNNSNISYLNNNMDSSYMGKMNAAYTFEQKIMMNLYSDTSSNYNEFHQDISPDGQKILELFANDDYTIGTKLYDVALKEETSTYDEAFPVCWLPDSSGFVGVDDYLFIQSVKSVERKNLLKVDEIIGKTTDEASEKRNFALENLTGGIDLKVSKDGKYAYIFSRNTEENNLTNLFSVNLEDGTFTKTDVQGIINNMVSLSSDTLLIQGKISGKTGTFLYNIKENDFKNILREEALSIQVSPDGEKIAYTVQNGDTRDIHMAYINSDNISNDEVIYTDRNYISTIRWTRDSRRLSCIVNNIIYEFSFKNM